MFDPAKRIILLKRLLMWLVVLLIVIVTIRIVANYADYAPLNFQADFLIGREAQFQKLFSPYRIAFYSHIVVSPLVLLNGLWLLNDRLRNRWRRVHRILGRVQVAAILLVVVPSSLVMACYPLVGWPAGLSFMLLTGLTTSTTLLGTHAAMHRQFARHRLWMQRTFVLLSSAIVLRLISGTLSLIIDSNGDLWYIAAAWLSWLGPLLLFECGRSWLK